MLARARTLRRMTAVVLLGLCTFAVGCGKADYERQLDATVLELTKQAIAEETGEVPAEEPAPAN